MAFNIYIIPLKNVKRTWPEGFFGSFGSLATAKTHLSYNFGDYANRWGIGNSVNKLTQDVAMDLREALSRLCEEGFHPTIPDGCNGWTVNENVFAYHLKRLAELAEEHPDHYFVTDEYGIDIDELDLGESDSASHSASHSASDSDAETEEVEYFPHPIDGNMRVDSFAKALEVAACVAKSGSPAEAEMWIEYGRKFLSQDE